ncbi:phosphate ABC transporter permease subunit PstC [Ancylomarina sp. 16SWW S1-10-2]|uniref:phosphate ABC transporter permease subunit PstC n=1 Tax=Ancylomarina sp. 16SWW S1-10-2 TaxID=2499681 RepID=UPI0012AE4ECD|nr:phosphate ABC transporter permease subunit PstC [Ancylomarina sp. 16SWW S1-10-2]MRT94734.1 phosphate ABC transporter permease subunit PstC [Ancylomarina sp. 16SWW S1-10-2]
MKSEKLFQYFLKLGGIIVLMVAIGILVTLIIGSIPTFKEFGFGFIFSSNWNPTEGRESYGALPFIIGTIVTSILALVLTFPFALSIALFLGEYFKKGRISSLLKTMIDLLAGIPSVVYGLWGFYTIRPIIVELGLNAQGFGIFTSAFVLAIMIIPYASSISAEVINMVPSQLKEAAYSLGATRFEVVKHVIIPNAGSGIFAGFILAFGRAIGETMAVTMLIGNSNNIPTNLFDIGNTMASLIANQFGEAEGLKYTSLVAMGLLLFVITGILNLIGKMVMRKFTA